MLLLRGFAFQRIILNINLVHICLKSDSLFGTSIGMVVQVDYFFSTSEVVYWNLTINHGAHTLEKSNQAAKPCRRVKIGKLQVFPTLH